MLKRLVWFFFETSLRILSLSLVVFCWCKDVLYEDALLKAYMSTASISELMAPSGRMQLKGSKVVFSMPFQSVSSSLGCDKSQCRTYFGNPRPAYVGYGFQGFRGWWRVLCLHDSWRFFVGSRVLHLQQNSMWDNPRVMISTHVWDGWPWLLIVVLMLLVEKH